MFSCVPVCLSIRLFYLSIYTSLCFISTDHMGTSKAGGCRVILFNRSIAVLLLELWCLRYGVSVCPIALHTLFCGVCVCV